MISDDTADLFDMPAKAAAVGCAERHNTPAGRRVVPFGTTYVPGLKKAKQ